MIQEKKGSLCATMVAVTVFYVVALCLNGEALLRNAELMRYGMFRDVMVVLAQPFASIARRGPGWLRVRVADKRDAFWKGVDR